MMTPSKRLALLDYFEKQPIHCAKNSKDRYSNANILSKFQPQFFKVLDHETGELSFVASHDIQTLKYN